MTSDAGTPPRQPSFCVVVETDNFELDDFAALCACLDSLALQQPCLARAEGVYLLHDGSHDGAFDRLRDAYRWLTVVRAETGTSYVGLKAGGMTLASSEVVVFCDSDVRYEAGWLDALLSGFGEQPSAQIVCGETSTPIDGPYGLAVALTFNFPRFSGDSHLAAAPMYWANNVAIRRRLLETLPIPDPAELYRGQNVVHSLAIARRGLIIWRQPRARAHHVVPTPSNLFPRYVTLGRDSASIARLVRNDSGRLSQVMAPDRGGKSRMRKLWGRLRQVGRANPADLRWLPLAAPIVALLVASYFVGILSSAPRDADPHVQDRAPG